MSRKSKWMILPWNSVKSLVLSFWKKWNLPIRRMFVRSSNWLRGKPDTVGWGVHARWTGQSVSSSQSLSCVRLFATPWIATRQAHCPTPTPGAYPLMSIESVMPSSHLILCRPLLLLPSIFPSIRVFSNESALHIRCPKYWSFSFNISPSNEHPGLISFRMDWLDLLAVQGTLRVFSNTTVQKHQFFGAQLSSQSSSHIHTWPLEKP